MYTNQDIFQYTIQMEKKYFLAHVTQKRFSSVFDNPYISTKEHNVVSVEDSVVQN